MQIGAMKVQKDATPEEHGVRVTTQPGGEGARSSDWYREEASAKARYKQLVDEWREHDGRLLARMQRVEQFAVVEQEFIVTRPTTY